MPCQDDQLTAETEEQDMTADGVAPQFTQSPLPVNDLACGLSDGGARCMDHTYGLPAEARDDPIKVLKQQKCMIECLTEREKELEDIVKAREEEVAKLQLECYRKEGEVSRRDLELAQERQRNQWLQAQLRAAYDIVQQVHENGSRHSLSYNVLVANSKELQYHTGFACAAMLDNFFSILKPDIRHLQFWQVKRTGPGEDERRFVIPLEDQFIMTLVRLRHGLDGADLARRYI